MSPEVQNRGIDGSTIRIYVLQKILKKRKKILLTNLRLLVSSMHEYV